MLHNKRDMAHLLDMYNYCVIVKQFVKGVKYYHFSINKEKLMAVERGIEIIGEASNRVSDETKDILQNIPWAEIRGLRNRLAHEYDDIKTTTLYKIAKNDIPILLKELKKIKELKKHIAVKS